MQNARNAPRAAAAAAVNIAQRTYRDRIYLNYIMYARVRACSHVCVRACVCRLHARTAFVEARYNNTSLIGPFPFRAVIVLDVIPPSVARQTLMPYAEGMFVVASKQTKLCSHRLRVYKMSCFFELANVIISKFISLVN